MVCHLGFGRNKQLNRHFRRHHLPATDLAPEGLAAIPEVEPEEPPQAGIQDPHRSVQETRDASSLAPEPQGDPDEPAPGPAREEREPLQAERSELHRFVQEAREEHQEILDLMKGILETIAGVVRVVTKLHQSQSRALEQRSGGQDRLQMEPPRQECYCCGSHDLIQL